MMKPRIKTPEHNSRDNNSVKNFTFYLYSLYIISFFLHLPARFPGINVIRPDMLLVMSIFLMLAVEQDKFEGRLTSSSSKIMKIMLVYIALSLPFVEWPGSVLNNLSVFIKAIIFFYFTVLIVDTNTRLKQLVFIFVLCQTFRVLEPLYLHLTSGYWGSKTYLGGGEFADRLGGSPVDVINPNGLAFVIAMAFTFLHYLLSTSTWKFKLVYTSILPAFLYALLLTLSRSGFIAMAVICWNILIHSRHKIVFIMVSLIALVALWSNMSPVQQERYLSLTGDEDVRGAETVQSRLSGWTKSMHVIAGNPVFGHGIGTSGEAMFNEIQEAHVSHILYMEILIELGFVGFIIYMAFIKSIYDTLKLAITKIQDIQSFVVENDQYNVGIDVNYYGNLVTALNASFWMYLVFSLAQYGVTEYHWYLLAGLVVLVERNLSVEIEKTSEYMELCAGQSDVPTEVATQARTHKLKYPERDKRVKK
jgi:hypothetical protein